MSDQAVGAGPDPLPPGEPAPLLVAAPSGHGRLAAIPVVLGLMVVAALWWAQAFLIPLGLSLLVSYALEPLVKRLESVHIARPLAVPLLLFVLLALTGLGAYGLRGEAVRFVEQLPDAARTVRRALRPEHGTQPGAVAKVQQAAQELENAAKDAARGSAPAGTTPVRIEEPTFKWSGYLWQGSRGVLEFGGQLFVMLCLVYYLLASGDLYRRKIMRIAGPSLSRKKTTVQILQEIDLQIERFLVARLVISAVVGVVVWFGFWMLGLREAGIWGVVAAVLFSVPYVGPAAVTVGAGVAGFVQFGTLAMAAAAGGLSLTIAAIEGNVLSPLLMSRASRMNAVAVFVSLLFWGWIWGVWGLLLAVPIMAVVKAVCEHVDELGAYAELLKE